MLSKYTKLLISTARKNRKKCSYKCINNKRRAKEYLNYLIGCKVGNIVTKDVEKAGARCLEDSWAGSQGQGAGEIPCNPGGSSE